MKMNVTNALQALQPPRPGNGDPNQIGASEVGDCPRLLVHRRKNPENTDSWIGKAMRGHALEPHCIAIAQVLLETQGWQLEYAVNEPIEYTDGPITAHPDFNAWSESEVVCNDIKTANQGVFRKIRKGDIPSYHHDQVLAQIGTCRAEGHTCKRGVLWYFLADDLNECETITIDWDEAAYAKLKDRATEAQTALLFGMLPKGEMGYQCAHCPIRDECPSWKHDKPKVGDFTLELHIQSILEELRELDPPKTDEDKAREKRIEALKSDLKGCLPNDGITLGLAEVKWTERAGSFDSIRFAKDYPDLTLAYRKESTRFPGITWKE